MGSQAPASSGQASARRPPFSTNWIAVLSVLAAIAFVLFARDVEPSFTWLLGRASYLVLTVLLLTRFFRESDALRFDRNASAMWLSGFACISGASLAIIRLHDTEDATFFALAALLAMGGIALLLKAYTMARAAAGSRPERQMILTGTGLTLIALLLQLLEGGNAPRFSVLTGLFFFLFALFVLWADWQGLPAIEVAAPLYAVSAILAVAFHLHLQLVWLLWTVGTAILTFEVYRRIRGGSTTARFVAPERMWSGFGLLVPAGMAICVASVFAQWHPPDAATGPEPFGVLMATAATAIAAFLLVPFIMMLKAPALRTVRTAGAIVFTLLPGLWWMWVVRMYHTPDGEPISLVERGPMLYAAGAVIIISGVGVLAFLDRKPSKA